MRYVQERQPLVYSDINKQICLLLDIAHRRNTMKKKQNRYFRLNYKCKTEYLSGLDIRFRR